MITKWLNSLRVYSLSVIGIHFFIIAYFFPVFVIKVVFIPLTFVVFWHWCELIVRIEEENRNQILHLIQTSDNQHTREVLAYELFLHDENSLSGKSLFNSHGI